MANERMKAIHEVGPRLRDSTPISGFLLPQLFDSKKRVVRGAAAVYALYMEPQSQPYHSLMRFYEAEARYSSSGSAADRDSLLATLHPDIVLYQPESLPYGGHWKGRGGFVSWLDAFAATWINIKPVNPVFHLCGEDMLVSTVTMHAIARSTGVPVEMPMCQVMRFSDDMPIEWRNFAWDTARMLGALQA